MTPETEAQVEELQGAIRSVERERGWFFFLALGAVGLLAWQRGELWDREATGPAIFLAAGFAAIHNQLCALRIEGFRREVRRLMAP